MTVTRWHYHVRIRRVPPHREVAMLDVPLRQLIVDFVRPIKNREGLVVQGVILPPGHIEWIRISRSSTPGAERLAEYRSEASRSLTGGVPLSPEWQVAAAAADVTDEIMAITADDPLDSQSLSTGHSFKIFVSYRRGKVQSSVRRLADDLGDRFGPTSVFLDVNDIVAGSPWPAELTEAINGADVIVAVLDRHWLTAQDDWGKRRIDSPEDWVRKELTLAFANGQPVVPVAIGRVLDLGGADLPRGIEQLKDLQQISISDATWHTTIGKVIEAVGLHRPRSVR